MTLSTCSCLIQTLAYNTTNEINQLKTKSIKTAGYNNATLHAKRDRKRAEAIARNNEWARHTVEEAIASLNTRRGESKRQLARLNALPC